LDAECLGDLSYNHTTNWEHQKEKCSCKYLDHEWSLLRERAWSPLIKKRVIFFYIEEHEGVDPNVGYQATEIDGTAVSAKPYNTSGFVNRPPVFVDKRSSGGDIDSADIEKSNDSRQRKLSAVKAVGKQGNYIFG